MAERADDLTPLERQFDGSFRRNFSRFLEPDFWTALRRFISAARYFSTSSVVVGTTPVQLVGRDPGRIQVWIFNNGNQTIFVGRGASDANAGSRVNNTSGDQNAGFPILQNTGLVITALGTPIWAISASGNQDVRVAELAQGAV